VDEPVGTELRVGVDKEVGGCGVADLKGDAYPAIGFIRKNQPSIRYERPVVASVTVRYRRSSV